MQANTLKTYSAQVPRIIQLYVEEITAAQVANAFKSHLTKREWSDEKNNIDSSSKDIAHDRIEQSNT